MAAGYLFNGQCFSTLADASAAHWSQTPVAMVPGSSSYLADVVWSGTVWQHKKYKIDSNGNLTLEGTTALPAVSFPTCDTSESFFDGMTLGWGVALAMIAAWLVKNLRRGL